MARVHKLIQENNTNDLKINLSFNQKGLEERAVFAGDEITPLQLAASINNIDALNVLLEKKANFYAKSSIKQKTALHFAIEHSNVEVINLLIDAIPRGDRLNIILEQDIDGKNALHYLVENIEINPAITEAIFDKLLKSIPVAHQSYFLNDQDKQGKTALHLLIDKISKTGTGVEAHVAMEIMIKKLVDEGTKLTVMDIRGQRTIDMARSSFYISGLLRRYIHEVHEINKHTIDIANGMTNFVLDDEIDAANSPNVDLCREKKSNGNWYDYLFSANETTPRKQPALASVLNRESSTVPLATARQDKQVVTAITNESAAKENSAPNLRPVVANKRLLILKGQLPSTANKEDSSSKKVSYNSRRRHADSKIQESNGYVYPSRFGFTKSNRPTVEKQNTDETPTVISLSKNLQA